MPFFQQFALAYVGCLLFASLIFTRGGNGLGEIILTFGFFGLPFALFAAWIARLLENTFLRWTGAVVAVAVVFGALYLLAPNKNNFWAGAGLIALPAFLFASIWSFLSWKAMQ